MATLNHNKGGLFGYAQPESAPAPPRATPEPRVLINPRCNACQCEIIPQRRPRSSGVIEGMCIHCASFFGHDMMPGSTNETPESTLAKVAKLRDVGFVMMLRDISLGAPDGNTLSVQAADIFPCTASNSAINPDARPSKEHTWALFTLKLEIGSYSVVLFPHEWSPISFQTVMSLKSAKEIKESFISKDDKIGHFTPMPRIRKQIVAAFGRMINAQ